ncbi:MAG: hypothetical protein ACD_80C00156G0001 [uncultured bacterium (gcode 4)]|uniref:Uncharacterized protein n=1 Tax=uncultured bacterium (gcode 4) TaxID=1234023 RepID=K1X3X4_9BACT|nr:MAG: hypothetical protein ACD_80C00156G0001 [uncultured bacterium (gcode 4)]
MNFNWNHDALPLNTKSVTVGLVISKTSDEAYTTAPVLPALSAKMMVGVNTPSVYNEVILRV